MKTIDKLGSNERSMTIGNCDVSDREARAIRANEAKQEIAPIAVKPIILFNQMSLIRVT